MSVSVSILTVWSDSSPIEADEPYIGLDLHAMMNEFACDVGIYRNVAEPDEWVVSAGLGAVILF
jgi:hypothetical protein